MTLHAWPCRVYDACSRRWALSRYFVRQVQHPGLYALPASAAVLQPAMSQHESSWAHLIAIAPTWQAMEALPHGFNPTDRLLLHHGSLLADAYDAWFKRWNTAQNVRPPHAT